MTTTSYRRGEAGCRRFPHLLQTQFVGGAGQDAATLHQIGLESDRPRRERRRIEGAIDLHTPVSREHLYRLGKDIPDENRRHNAQADWPMYARRFQIIDRGRSARGAFRRH